MLLFLSKLLPVFVYPLGLAVILLISALCAPRLKAWVRVLLAVMLLLIILSSNRWVASALVRSLEWRYLPQENLPQADAIVLLGGGTEPADYPRPIVEVNGAGDRVLYAASLYRQGAASHILASGGRLPWEASLSSTPASEMQAILLSLGVPEAAIWLEPQSRNTEENAGYAKPILETNNVQSIILVTSAIHMPRAVYLFEQQGFYVIPAPTDYTVSKAEWEALLQPDWQAFLLGLLPQANYLNMTTTALKEYFGMAVNQVLQMASP